MKGMTMKSGWKGSDPLLSFVIEPLRNEETLSIPWSLFLRQDHLSVREGEQSAKL